MDSMYDEFGNYIGPDLDEDEGNDRNELMNSDDEKEERIAEEEEEWENQEEEEEEKENRRREEDEISHEEKELAVIPLEENRIILPENKQYYPEARAIYGNETDLVIGDEDTQPIEQPIIQPIKEKTYAHMEKQLPITSWDYRFFAGMMDHPLLIRHISIVGHLHHGKTSLMDIFIQQTHSFPNLHSFPIKYTDTRYDEQARALSIKSTPMSFLLPSLNSKHYLLSMIDTPGHVQFSDEVTAALRISDGAVIVIDAAEGVCLQTSRILKQCVKEGIKIMLVINKIDRLILELKLPPTDAYHKIVHTIEEVNNILQSCTPSYPHRLSPELNNIAFASPQSSYLFTLYSFSKLYADYHQSFPAKELAKRLWGNKYLWSDRKFRSKPENTENKRTFVSFILEPLYKIYSHVLGSEGTQLQDMMKEIGIHLTAEQVKLDSRPLLKLVLSSFFGDTAGFVDMIVQHTPSPLDNAQQIINHIYTGNLTTPLAKSLLSCDTTSPYTMIHITKLFSRPDSTIFDCFGRVYSGVVKVGDRVRVLGERYSIGIDEEDESEREITKIWILQGRYRVEVNRVVAGNVALFEGIDASISKTATIASLNTKGIAAPFRPLVFNTISAVKIALEPINPSELPKMLEGLRKIDKSYPLISTSVEESGEHVILGTGELYLDCVLHDLRQMYSECEIKVSDPVVKFAETVTETSSMMCFAKSANKLNQLTMIAEQLETELSKEIEDHTIRINDRKGMETILGDKFGWDLLSRRGVWSFGPEEQGANILVDQTLPSTITILEEKTLEFDPQLIIQANDSEAEISSKQRELRRRDEIRKKQLLFDIKDSVVEGFKWGAREGPLANEPIRQVKFKLTSATISSHAHTRPQMMPTARRVTYSSFLLASPRLMEPVYLVDILTPADAISAILLILSKRRGQPLGQAPKPGTPLYNVTAYLPIIESFGFETDLRTHTQGQAFAVTVFDHWGIVPGDPLDKSIILRPLEPAPLEALARDFAVKTRRRKGLEEDVRLHEYFDPDILLKLAAQDQVKEINMYTN